MLKATLAMTGIVLAALVTPAALAQQGQLEESKRRLAVEDWRNDKLVADTLRRATRVLRVDADAVGELLLRTRDSIMSNPDISTGARTRLAERLSRAIRGVALRAAVRKRRLPSPERALEKPTPRGQRLDYLGDPLPPGAIARLGTHRMRVHFLTTLTVSPDGKRIASLNSYRGRVQFWETSTGRLITAWKIPKKDFTSPLTFSAGGHYAAAAAETEVFVWKVATGEGVRRVAGCPAHVLAVRLSPDGKELLTVDKAGAVVWRALSTGKVIRRLDIFEGQRSPPTVDRRAIAEHALTPDGRFLAWRFDPPSPSPDGKPPPPRRQDTVHVWDLAAGKRLSRFEAKGDELALRPDGKVLAVAREKGILTLHEAATGRTLHRLKEPVGESGALAFSGDGRVLATGYSGTSLIFWDSATGKLLRRTGTPAAFGVESSLRSLSFSADGKVAAASYSAFYGVLSFDSIHVWDVRTGKESLTLPGHRDRVTSVWFSPDGREVRSASEDEEGVICYWDTRTWREKKRIPLAPLRLRLDVWGFSLAANMLVTMEKEGPLQFRELATGKHLRQFPINTKRALFADLSADGKHAVMGVLENERQEAFLYETGAGRVRCRLGTCPYDCSMPTFSPDGKWLAWGDSAGTVHVAETATGKTRRRLKADRAPSKDEEEEVLHCFAFSPDGRYLAAGYLWIPKGSQSRIRLWDLRTGRELVAFGAIKGPACMVFSPDSRTLAVSTLMDPSITLWEVDSRKVRRSFRGHREVVKALAFSPDGRLLVSGSDDGTLLVWDVYGPGQERPTGRTK